MKVNRFMRKLHDENLVHVKVTACPQKTFSAMCAHSLAIDQVIYLAKAAFCHLLHYLEGGLSYHVTCLLGGISI